MLHSVSWGLGKYYKEREKIWGKKAIFSHLSVPPIPPFIPYLPLLPDSSSSFFLPFIPPRPFFALYAAAHRMNSKCSYAVFTKSSDFSRSRGEWHSVAVVVGCGDISKAAFSCRYHASPPPVLLLFPYGPPPPSHPSMLQSSPVLWWDVRTEDGEGGGSIDRASILSGEMLQCDRAKPMLAESGLDLCCTLARKHLWWRHTRQGKQGQLQTHGLIWKEQPHYQKVMSFSVIFWRSGE